MGVIEKIHELFKATRQISIDTRKIERGSIFFALKGPNFNANTFAEEALKKGAAYCIIDDVNYKVNEQCILVNDVLETLQQLALFHRSQFNIPIIAIAGSNGKTTTKELITAVLQTTYNVHATPGNLNNHIGLPLTLLMLNEHHQVAVIEMGANHVGENAFLCEITKPTLGIVTNNGKDHLEGFGDMEGVAKSNSELYYYLLHHNGLAFVNAHDEWLLRMSSRLSRRITYAANTSNRLAQAHYQGKANQLQPNIVYEFAGLNGTSVLSGDYNFDNIMAAVSIGKNLGIADEKIIQGVASYQPSNNRSQWIKKNQNMIFMDAYNANPTSMEVALRNFAQMDHSNKLVILGDMFEMGKYAASEHQRIIDLCKELEIPKVIAIGNDFYQTSSYDYLKFEKTEEAAQYLTEHQVENSLIFIKGSRGMKLESLVNLIN